MARVLAAAGHDVVEVEDPADGLARCRTWAPDVAVLHVESCAGLVCDIKSDPVAYGTAILMIERPELSTDDALAGLRRGVQDYLIEPVADGEVLTRVEAAARTKELQKELVAQGARLEALLREDTLTGLSNRRAILTQLGGMVSAARRHGHPLSIAVLDLDHFKRINDTYGHPAGDAALVAVSGVLKQLRRADDLCCRYGGEEFVLLMEGTHGEDALAVAERLRYSIEALDFKADGQRVPLTLSAGVASFPDLYIKTAAELILFADEALYEAKRRGRNRCLLDIGQGRYMDVEGRVLTTDEATPAAEAPRIFA